MFPPFLCHSWTCFQRNWTETQELDFFPPSPRWCARTTSQTCQHCLLRLPRQQLKQKGYIYIWQLPSQFLLLFSHPHCGVAYTMPIITVLPELSRMQRWELVYSRKYFHLHSQVFMNCKQAIWQTLFFHSVPTVFLSLVTSYFGYKNFSNSQVCINYEYPHTLQCKIFIKVLEMFKY